MTKTRKSRTGKRTRRRMPRIDSSTAGRHSTRRRRKPMTEAPSRDPMQEFADRILTELENGVKPWVRP
jgi:antirestriction protein ArdC